MNPVDQAVAAADAGREINGEGGNVEIGGQTLPIAQWSVMTQTDKAYAPQYVKRAHELTTGSWACQGALTKSGRDMLKYRFGRMDRGPLYDTRAIDRKMVYQTTKIGRHAPDSYLWDKLPLGPREPGEVRYCPIDGFSVWRPM